jgi:putative DNA primase/helicase
MNPQVDIKAIIQEFGPPGYENANGKLSKLNQPFWANYYAKNREKIIYESCEREFYNYEPSLGIYTPKSADLIRTELSAMVFAGGQNWQGFQALEQFRSADIIDKTVAHLRGHVEHRDFFNHPTNFVHLGNCTLRFEPDGSKFTVEGFSPDHRCRNRSPINYDQNATCPEFQAKMLGHLPADDRVLLQKYCGQALLGRNLTQRFVILDGVGGSSKSSLVQVINGIVGPKNVYTLRTKLLDERFEIGRMVGRTLLVGPDVKGNFLNEPGAHVIKALVGGDTLEGESKGSNLRFPVRGVFNIMITSNCRLVIYLTSDQTAWERRIVIIRYDKPYTGQRIFEIEKYLLAKEAPGILKWCIDGLKLLFQDYSQAGDIILSTTQQTRVTDLLAESDSLRLFVQNEIVRDSGIVQNGALIGQHFSLTINEISTAYIDDCIKVKKWTPVSVDRIEKQLPDLMQRFFGVGKSNSLKRKNKGIRGYWNVKFARLPNP